MKRLALLGSTGSIGTNVLRIVDAFPDRFGITGLAAGRNVERLAEQVDRYRPRVVSVADEPSLEELGRRVDLRGVRALVGEAGMVEVATHDEAATVVAAAVGAVGLVPTYRALEAGKDVALANKETLVMAGELMLARARETGARLLPIDSEHCALHQCLDGRRPDEVRRLLLTASGGPFRNRPRETFDRITREEALAHPTWNMGPKISIDSATMMNKGLEYIEAKWLFGLDTPVEIIVHAQSIIHSMIEFVDTSVMAQLGIPDMRVPIAYALSYPDRVACDLPSLDLAAMTNLTFEEPDFVRFPCLQLAHDALEIGDTMPAVLNAANEIAVQAFLDQHIPFKDIAEAIRMAMHNHKCQPVETIEDVLAADQWAREETRKLITVTH